MLASFISIYTVTFGKSITTHTTTIKFTSLSYFDKTRHFSWHGRSNDYPSSIHSAKVQTRIGCTGKANTP
jgi:hypothetical protein